MWFLIPVKYIVHLLYEIPEPKNVPDPKDVSELQVTKADVHRMTPEPK